MTVLPFLFPPVSSVRPCGSRRVGLGECQLPPLLLRWGRRGVKKGVYPFNEGPIPGPSEREFSHYLPTEPAQPGREGGSGTRSGSAAGRSPGWAERGLLLGRARAQAPEPCWRGGESRRQVSTPGPSWEVWGYPRSPTGLGGQEKGQ